MWSNIIYTPPEWIRKNMNNYEKNKNQTNLNSFIKDETEGAEKNGRKRLD